MDTAGRTHTLTRSLDDRVVAGVAGGLAAHLEVDTSWVRLGFVVASFFWGVGLVIYALLWITLPEEPESDGAPVGPPLATGEPRTVVGILLLTLGLLVILWNVLSRLSFWIVLPILLVGLGLFLLVNRHR